VKLNAGEDRKTSNPLELGPGRKKITFVQRHSTSYTGRTESRPAV